MSLDPKKIAYLFVHEFQIECPFFKYIGPSSLCIKKWRVVRKSLHEMSSLHGCRGDGISKILVRTGLSIWSENSTSRSVQLEAVYLESLLYVGLNDLPKMVGPIPSCPKTFRRPWFISRNEI